MPCITFVNETKTISKSITVEPGTTVLEAARAAGVIIETPCNAIGICGKCSVQLSYPGGSKSASACQTKVFSDAEALVKDYTAENRSLQIAAGGTCFSYPKAPFITKRLVDGNTDVCGGAMRLGTETGDTTTALYGVAVDIGTTTIAASLVNLHTGLELAVDSMLNPQTRYAQDVVSRIHFAGQAGGLESLYRVFIDSLHTLIAGLVQRGGISPEQIYEAVYTGNTTMLHLATGTDPASLGQYPYTPQIWGGNHISATDLGIAKFGLIYLPPIISAFVGSDITAGILSSQLDKAKGITLFVDIGTNGEIVLAKDGTLAVTSTAAGPAFEGMNIACGMRAHHGAIESFSINEQGKLSFKVIGKGPATGICGSGLLDSTSELVRTGVIESSGRLASPQGGAYEEPLKKRIREKDGQRAFFITDEVYLAQKDIRQVQLAKSAIRAGITMLLSHFSISSREVDRVEIAGSFGYHLNEKSLLNLGLLPKDFAGKIAFVGNTSMSGGIGFLLNTGFREQMSRTVKHIYPVELVKGSDFEDLFVTFLSFSQ